VNERQARNYEKMRTIVKQDRRDNDSEGQAEQLCDVHQTTMDQKHNLMMSSGGIASDDDDEEIGTVESPER
jgi:hypothetical protein